MVAHQRSVGYSVEARVECDPGMIPRLKDRANDLRCTSRRQRLSNAHLAPEHVVGREGDLASVNRPQNEDHSPLTSKNT